MIEVRKFNKLSYTVRFPEGYAGGKMPVILHIHGAGGRGTDIEIIRDHYIHHALDKINENRFIVVSPQCYADTWFEIFNELLDFAEMVRNAEYTDEKHFYAMGASMGGYTTWQIAMTRPEYFAAIVPVCGGGMYWNAERIKDIPLWIFHGIQDDVIFVEEAIRMTEKLRGFGGKVKLTLYDNCCHDSWTKAYATPELYEWLLSQSR